MNQVLHYEAGQRIIQENELSQRMFIIQKGSVRVYKYYMGQKIQLAKLGHGEIFGEMSFFDAEPRSASVDAITPVDLLVIDQETAMQQMKDLPRWIMPVMKTVFQRLRDADHRMTVLQSMNEVQKRHFKRDTVAETLYTELLRFIKTLRVCFEQLKSRDPRVPKREITQEMDEMLGTRHIGLNAFWKMLIENDFVKMDGDDGNALILELREVALDQWIEYLNAEISTGRYLLLSHSALALLRRICHVIQAAPNSPIDWGEKQFGVSAKDIDLDSLPLANEALSQLGISAAIKADEQIMVIPAKIYREYLYQTILKSLDPAVG